MSTGEKPRELYKPTLKNNLFQLNVNTFADYKFSDQWSLFLSPFWSFGLQYFSIGDQPIGQKYDIISIRLGLNKDI